MVGVRGGVFGQRSLQPGKLDRAVEGGRACVAFAAGDTGEQLGIHGDDGVGLEPEGLVGVVASGGTGSLADASQRGEEVGVGAGVPNLPECVCIATVPDSQDGPEVGVSTLGLESSYVNIVQADRQTELLSG